jgi:hypothetical protein
MSDDHKEIHTALTVTVPVAARMLGLKSKNAAYKAAREGSIPTIKIGDRLVVSTARLRQMLGLEREVA